MKVTPETVTGTVIVGEIVAGHSAKVRKQLEFIIKNLDKGTFDIMDLMYEVKNKHYYTDGGFKTFAEYIKSLNFKIAKAYYLAQIKEVMVESGIPREKYEPLGIAKLREISRLNPSEEWNGSPMKDYITGLVENGQDKTLEQIKEFVRTLKGEIGDNDKVWENICLTRVVRDKIFRPAIELAKAKLGSSYRDKDGNAVEPSDAAALEVLCVEFLNDPANQAELLGGNDGSSKE